jgi:mRNA-degrading endonuclease RelE of RelBE toxin-antitoxin system
MIHFFSTEAFRKSLDSYLKKDEYKYCIKDLCDFFSDKSIDIIFTQPILIAPNKNIHFIKSRINNSIFNKGKSGGYRLYYYVDKTLAHVYLIGYYPKTGRYGKDDLTDTELKILIRNFASEKQKGVLKEHDITNDFTEIDNV